MATEQQFLPDGSVPPDRDDYLLPSFRRVAPEIPCQHITTTTGVVLDALREKR
jgi:hypothetical protein